MRADANQSRAALLWILTFLYQLYQSLKMSVWFKHGETSQSLSFSLMMKKKMVKTRYTKSLINFGIGGSGTQVNAVKKQVTKTTAIKQCISIMPQLKAKAKLITPLWYSQCVGFNYSCEQQYEHCKHLYRLFGSLSRGSCSSSFIASATQSGSSIIFFLAFINYPVTKLLKQRIENVFPFLGRLNLFLFLTPNLCMLDVWRSPHMSICLGAFGHVF